LNTSFLWIAVLILSLTIPEKYFAQTMQGPESNSAIIVHVPSPLEVEVEPLVDLPLADSANYFSTGGGMAWNFDYHVSNTFLGLMGGLQYIYTPDQADKSLSLTALRIGGSANIPLGGGLRFSLFGLGGYYFASMNGESNAVVDPYVAGGFNILFPIGPNLKLEGGAQYNYFLGLYQGFGAGIGVSIPLGNIGGTIDIPTTELNTAFPVFYKFYDDHTIGTLELQSNLKVPASNVQIQVYVKEYMDAPKRIDVPGRLNPGETKIVDLYALFNDKVLGITEGTKVATEITVSFTAAGQSYQGKRIATLTILGRNAMTWDDNRKAAAFVTAKDPEVLGFARSVTSYIHSKEARSIVDTLQSAVALHEALDLYGINYTPNPKTPYEEVSKQRTAIDFLQFPRETFQYRAGDCSDISILFASLLEAVGIEAAFITVPGHIFVAINTGVQTSKAADDLLNKTMIIDSGGIAWVPVEITMRNQGFLRAWQLGAKEWAENSATGLAGFYPVEDAWAVYQPVGLPGTENTLAMPQADAILHAYLAEMQKLIDDSVQPQIVELKKQISAQQSPAAMNRLGVLYAKYGEPDEAEANFKMALAVRPYLPAIINLGNLYFLKDNWQEALSYYEQANGLAPNNPRILLGIARAARELQDYPLMAQVYGKVKSIDPKLASEFAYLGEEQGGRAVDVESARRAVLWESEE